MTTFQCPSGIMITSWLFTARWSTWPGNHLVPCVAELVGSCFLIHAHRCLPDPKCLFYPSGLSLCLCASLSTTFALSQLMTWFSSTAWSVMATEWVAILCYPTNSATHGTRWFPGYVLHQAVNNQDMIKMSDGHWNVIIIIIIIIMLYWTVRQNATA